MKHVFGAVIKGCLHRKTDPAGLCPSIKPKDVAMMIERSATSPTRPFTILELKNPPHDVPEQHKIR